MANDLTMQVNSSISITTSIIDAYGAATSAKTINYISSDPSVATLANSGTFIAGLVPLNSSSTNTIYAIGNGTATITVTVDGTLMGTIDIVVNSPPPSGLVFVFGTPIQS